MNTNALTVPVPRTLHTTHVELSCLFYEEEVEQERLTAAHAAKKPLTSSFEKLLKGALIGNC